MFLKEVLGIGIAYNCLLPIGRPIGRQPQVTVWGSWDPPGPSWMDPSRNKNYFAVLEEVDGFFGARIAENRKNIHFVGRSSFSKRELYRTKYNFPGSEL